MIIWSTALERENYKQINEYKQRLIDKELHLEQMKKILPLSSWLLTRRVHYDPF